MPRPRRTLPLLALATALLAFPLGVLASHQFADVPDSNPFHADIDALVDSGVTSGCGGGNYCPSANVTREQMAAFLNRLGALAPGKTPVVNAAKLGGLTASQFERSDTVATGHYNCHGSAMFPTTGAVDYGTAGGRESVNSGASFACPVILPDGATVTTLVAFLKDSSATEQISGCSLRRMNLVTGGQFVEITVAGSGVAATLGTTQIASAPASLVIDNDLNAYEAECAIAGTGSDITLQGIMVIYEVTGLAIP